MSNELRTGSFEPFKRGEMGFNIDLSSNKRKINNKSKLDVIDNNESDNDEEEEQPKKEKQRKTLKPIPLKKRTYIDMPSLRNKVIKPTGKANDYFEDDDNFSKDWINFMLKHIKKFLDTTFVRFTEQVAGISGSSMNKLITNELYALEAFRNFYSLYNQESQLLKRNEQKNKTGLTTNTTPDDFIKINNNNNNGKLSGLDILRLPGTYTNPNERMSEKNEEGISRKREKIQTEAYEKEKLILGQNLANVPVVAGDRPDEYYPILKYPLDKNQPFNVINDVDENEKKINRNILINKNNANEIRNLKGKQKIVTSDSNDSAGQMYADLERRKFNADPLEYLAEKAFERSNSNINGGGSNEKGQLNLHALKNLYTKLIPDVIDNIKPLDDVMKGGKEEFLIYMQGLDKVNASTLELAKLLFPDAKDRNANYSTNPIISGFIKMDPALTSAINEAVDRLTLILQKIINNGRLSTELYSQLNIECLIEVYTIPFGKMVGLIIKKNTSSLISLNQIDQKKIQNELYAITYTISNDIFEVNRISRAIDFNEIPMEIKTVQDYNKLFLYKNLSKSQKEYDLLMDNYSNDNSSYSVQRNNTRTSHNYQPYLTSAIDYL